MKKAKHLLISTTFLAALCVVSYSTIAKGNDLLDYRAPKQSPEIIKMQDFHLQNAQKNIENNEFAYAWGDYAYILCHVPNHHVAIQHMLKIAPQIKKENEMQKFFAKAMQLFPEDAELLVLYSSFLTETGDQVNAKKYLEQAIAMNPELASKN